MKIDQIVSRHRNDFVWIGKCRHCGHTCRYGDGYADRYYCTEVAPARHCPKCGLNCAGEKKALPTDA